MTWSRTIPVVGALALAGLAAWLFVDGRPHASEDPPEAVGERAAARPASPSLAASPESTSPPRDVPPWTPERRSVQEHGIAIAGRVIDVEGRPLSGGDVRVRRRGAADVLGSSPVSDGRFEVRLPDAHAGWIVVDLVGRGVAASSADAIEVAAGTRVEGVELVATPTATLRLAVVDAAGRPAPEAIVTLHPSGIASAPAVVLDEGGSATLELAVVPWRVRARTPDGRWRAAAPVKVASGEVTDLRLSLVGPWEEISVRCESQPDRTMSGRTVRLDLSTQDGLSSEAEAVVDGGRVLLQAPRPQHQRVRISAYEGSTVVGALDVASWNDSWARRAANDGLVLPVVARSRVRLRFVDEDGSPLAGLWVSATGTEWWTDGTGSLELTVPYGSLELSTRASPSKATVDARAPDVERTLTVVGLRRVGGTWRLPPVPNLHLFSVAVLSRDEKVWIPAFGDRESARWWAWVPLPEGTPVRVRVECPRRFVFRPDDEGRVGRDDVDLDVTATALTIEPRAGALARPRGTLRTKRLGTPPPAATAAMGSTSQVLPTRPRVTLSPIHPGTYEVAFQVEGETGWLVHPEPIEVGSEPVERVIDFAPR